MVLLLGLLPAAFAPMPWTPPAAAMLPASASASASVPFDIDGGSLDQALKQWARQCGMQILYPPRQVAGRNVPALRARMVPAQALQQLLQGTALVPLQVNANTYTLQAQPRAATPAPAKAAASTEAAAPSPSLTELPALYITGSHIPRPSPQGSSPLTLIARAQIESSGYSSLFELLRVQPAMTGHHPVDVASESGLSYVPTGAAAAVSLSSLGPRATLFLVDGRRIASYGMVSSELGALSDLNSIPLSLVERVEIMRGGASAIYGADAMAGVVNIVLRKDFDGSEVSARYGLSSRGDAMQRRLSVLSGFRAGSGQVLLSADHLHRQELPGDARAWRSDDRRGDGLRDARIPLGEAVDGGIRAWPHCRAPQLQADGRCMLDAARHASLQPQTDSTSAYVRYARPLGHGIDLRADLRVADVRQRLLGAPTYGYASFPETLSGERFPEGNYAFLELGPVSSRSRARSDDVALGLAGEMARWSWTLGLSWSRNRADNRIDGTVNEPALYDAVVQGRFRPGQARLPAALREEISPTLHTGGQARQRVFSTQLHGPLLELPGGELQLALGAEARNETLHSRPDGRLQDGEVALSDSYERRSLYRDTSSLFAELGVPLHQRLLADIAWRLDRSSGRGAQLSPKFGLQWLLGTHLTVRGTYGDGYRAPTPYEMRRPAGYLDEEGVAWNPPGADACRWQLSADACLVLVRTSENPALKPETSRSHTLGVAWSDGGLQLALDRYRIVRRHEIVIGDALADLQAWPDSWLLDEAGRIYALDVHLANAGRTELDAWNLDAGWQSRATGWGSFGLRLSGYYLQSLRRQAWPGAPDAQLAGFEQPRRTALGSVQWQYGDWTTTLDLRHVGTVRAWRSGGPCPRYKAAAGRCRTPAYLLSGLDVAYRGFERWVLALHVANLADRAPVDYREINGGYRIGSDDPFGRYFTFSASYRFGAEAP